MNYIKVIMIVCAVIALGAGMAVAAVTSDSLDEQHQMAVSSGSLAPSVEEVESVSEPEPEPEPTRNYFDIPLSHDVQDHIFSECEKHDIDPAVIVAMIKQESNFNTYNLGDDGRSAGLMQIQAKWHLKRMKKLKCTDLFDPYQNITVGVHYLAELLDRYDGDMAKALTAYNRGSYQGTVTNYAKGILNNAERMVERE